MSILSAIAALSVAIPAPLAQEVPFKLGENAIIVDAQVNGRKLSFMFDTGFSGTVVVDDKISLGPATGTITLRDFVGQMQAKTVKVKTLKLGDLSVPTDDMEAVMQPMDGMSFSYNIHTDGIMGFQVIKKQITEINFQNKKFIFHPASYDITKKTPDNQKTFLLKMLPMGNDSIELPVATADGKKLHLALDTGNAFYATTHRDVLERVGRWSPSANPKYAKKSMVASGEVDSWSKKMNDMVIFGVPVKTSYWDIIDLPSSSAEGDGTVGFGFLKNFNITIDYERRRVWLENFTGEVENKPDAEIGISAAYSTRIGRVVVFDVSPESPAHKAGVKAGDTILSVNDNEIGHAGYRAMENLWRGEPGTKVKISASRNGTLHRYEIERAVLVND